MTLTQKAQRLREQADAAEKIEAAIGLLAGLLDENPDLRDEALNTLGRPSRTPTGRVRKARPAPPPAAGLVGRVRLWVAQNPNREFTSTEISPVLGNTSSQISSALRFLGVPVVATRPQPNGLGRASNVYRTPPAGGHPHAAKAV